jgi:hypothetical protein
MGVAAASDDRQRRRLVVLVHEDSGAVEKKNASDDDAAASRVANVPVDFTMVADEVHGKLLMIVVPGTTSTGIT